MPPTSQHLTVSRAELVQSGLPARYWDWDTTDYCGNQPALLTTVDYALRFEQAVPQHGLCYLGLSDTCKTLLAVHVGRIVMAYGRSVLYRTLDQLAEEYMLQFDDGGHAGSFRRLLLGPDLLILDDVQAVSTRSAATALQQALKLRCEANKPTIVCSTLPTKNDFAAIFGDKVATLLNSDFGEVRTSLEHPARAQAIVARRFNK